LAAESLRAPVIRPRPAAAVAPEDAPLAAWLAGRRVLVAYGLLGDATAALRRVGIDYMWAQQDWLRAVGAAPEVVRAPTAASVAANAARIRAALLASGRPALVVAHSKGGLEALAALLDPAAAARCAGFVAFQSPFFGSPVADAVAGSLPLRGLALAAFRALRIGDGEGLRDLTTPVRAAWMRAHADAVAELLHRVPVVTAATRLDAAAMGGIGRDRAYGIVAR
jgi:alpha-beta hydrolase superfamily lysophospholipase